jgi:hypothetical protein
MLFVMKATRLLLFSLSVFVLCSQAFGQQYDLQFVVVQNNGVNLDVKLQVKAPSGSFGMGDANLVFSYPTNVLGSPVLLSAHNFNSGFYSPMTITKPSGRISYSMGVPVWGRRSLHHLLTSRPSVSMS